MSEFFNPMLPFTQNMIMLMRTPKPKKEEKKRDAKAKDKQDVKNAKNEDEKAEGSDVEKDEKGNIVLTNADFENP